MKMKLLETKTLYSDGKYNAWTDICRWAGRYYAIFNAQAQGHRGGHKHYMIMSSPDGWNWDESTLLDTSKEIESGVCFQPKFLPTADRLYIFSMVFVPNELDLDDQKRDELEKRWLSLGGDKERFEYWVACHRELYQTYSNYTQDGKNWSSFTPFLDDGWQIHTTAEFEGRYYMVPLHSHTYQWEITPALERMIPIAHELSPIFTDETWGKLKARDLPNGTKAQQIEANRPKRIEIFETCSLMSSTDGTDWRIVSDLPEDDNDESTVGFNPTGKALVVSRIGAAGKHSFAYVADPPYKKWRRISLDQVIQQPAVQWVNGSWIVAGRGMDPESLVGSPLGNNRLVAYHPVCVWQLDDQTGELSDKLVLPSWGDCGTPGFVMNDDEQMLVIYYSHDERTEETKMMGGGPLPGKLAPVGIYLARIAFE